MKKLMILAALAMACVSANAAAYTWKAASGYIYDGNGSTSAKVTSGTAYLFNADAYSQATLLEAIVGGASLESIASANAINGGIGGSIGAGGQIASSAEFTYNGVAVGNTFTAYFATMVDDKVYISTEKTGVAAMESPDVASISFGLQTSASKVLKGNAADGYDGAGWYSAVPEPTSGLMMLLGMGVLALRRRRA